ncbi:MAG: CpsB/CapC family capsule biosynthesis tyrosine phosphatase [Bacteroidota bacterium]|nr:CpsB/CapC family capsule biosynthesis tyrosine phosphatase [Bacteroidota bacterium]
MLKWFLKKEEKELDPLDFSVLKTDIHSHFIPGIDDGSPDMGTTMNLIQEMQKLGFSKVITSPHVMSDFYKNSSDTILKGLTAVRTELKEQNINMEIDAVAEYYLDYDFEQKIGKEKFLTFGDDYILVELSFMEASKNLFDIIFKLQLEGYKVVLAHPERYHYFQMKDYKDLVTRGVLLQINWLSLIGYYSSQIKNITEDLIAQDMVSFLGTDCHNMNHAALYKKCQTKKAWHDLYNSGKLLNSTL